MDGLTIVGGGRRVQYWSFLRVGGKVWFVHTWCRRIKSCAAHLIAEVAVRLHSLVQLLYSAMHVWESFLALFLKHEKLDFQVIYWFPFSATPGRGQVPRPARKNDTVAVVHHHHLHQDQEAAPLAHAARQGLVLRVPVLLPDLDQSLNRDPDQVLPNHQVQGKEGLVFVLWWDDLFCFNFRWQVLGRGNYEEFFSLIILQFFSIHMKDFLNDSTVMK